MATVGSLNVKLAATTASFESSMSKAQTTLKSFGGAVQQLSAFDVTSIGGGLMDIAKGAAPAFAGPIAGAVAFAGAIAAAGEHTGRMAMEHQHLANRLNTSAIGLKALEKIAGQTGATQEEVTHGLTRLQRELGAAAAGSEEARGKFSKLGLDWKTLAGQSTDQAFASIADKVALLPSAAERSAVAFGLLGKGGNALQGMLSRGGDSIRESMEKVRASGAVMSRSQVEFLERTNVAWKSSSSVITNALAAGKNRFSEWWGFVKLGSADMLAWLTGRQAELAKAYMGHQAMQPHAAAQALEASSMQEKFAEQTRHLVEELDKEALAIGKTADQVRLLDAAQTALKQAALADEAEKNAARGGQSLSDMKEQLEATEAKYTQMKKDQEYLAKIGAGQASAPNFETGKTALQQLESDIIKMAQAIYNAETSGAVGATQILGDNAAKMEELRMKLEANTSKKFGQGLVDELSAIGLQIDQIGKSPGQAKVLEFIHKMKKDGVAMTEAFADGLGDVSKAADAKEAAAALHGFNESLRMQAEAFGKGSNEAAAYALAQKSVAGATLDGAIAQGKFADAMGRVRGMIDVKSPFEGFSEKIADLQMALAKGLDFDKFGKAGMRAFEDMEKSMPKAAPNPQALTFGSSAAESAVLNARNQNRDAAVTVQERIEKVLNVQREIAQRQLDEAREMGRALEKLNVPKVMKF